MLAWVLGFSCAVLFSRGEWRQVVGIHSGHRHPHRARLGGSGTSVVTREPKAAVSSLEALAEQ